MAGERYPNLSDRKIVSLYFADEDTTCADVAKKLGCSAVTVRNRIVRAGKKLKRPSRRKNYFDRSPFVGSSQDKMYVLGFAIGDLNVYKNRESSKGVIVRSHTTHIEQRDLVETIFSPYGRVKTSISKKTGSFTTNCYMHESFSFLLNKKRLPLVELRERSNAWAFTAGYVDAEGNFIINQGRARFKLDSYDYHVLKWITSLLKRSDIKFKFNCIAEKGSRHYAPSMVWNADLWRLNINEARSLEKFIDELMPYLRHKRRIGAAKKSYENIKLRRANGTIK